MQTKFFFSLLSVSTAFVVPIAAAQNPTSDVPTVRAIAKDAYIYGVPLLDQYRVMYAYSGNKDSPEYKGPFNTVLNIARVFTPDDTAFVTPNSDTPYSFASLDLRREPMVLTLPKIEKNRYNVFQMMDLYTFNFAYLGTRTSGNDGGNFLIAGPEWKGEAPKNIKKVIQTETEFVSIVGRTQLFNSADLENVKKIQAGYKLQPLSTFLGKTPPSPAPEITWHKSLTPAEQRNSPEFFNVLNFILQFCPVHPSEKELRERFTKIGILPGKTIDFDALPPAIREAMKNGMAEGQKEIDAKRTATGSDTGGLFGTRAFLKNDFVARAAGSQFGIGANSREEALYPGYSKDANGRPLDASKADYVIHFPKGQLPPVNSFWSLTMYDAATQLLVKNPLNRYLINSPMLPDLKVDADGGLTLYIQNKTPGQDRESNWLPAPNGPFMMVLRLYGPKPEVLNGTWKTPYATRVKN